MLLWLFVLIVVLRDTYTIKTQPKLKLMVFLLNGFYDPVRPDDTEGWRWSRLWQRVCWRSIHRSGQLRERTSPYPWHSAAPTCLETPEQRRATEMRRRTGMEEVSLSSGALFLVWLVDNAGHCSRNNHSDTADGVSFTALVAEGRVLPPAACTLHGCRQWRGQPYQQ